MTFFAKYIKKYWKLFTVTLFFLALEAFCDLLQPTIMANIIDEGVANNDLDHVLRMGGLMLLITALGAVAACSRNVLSSFVSQKFGAELRFDLFAKIQSLSFVNIDKFERASLITRLTNDVTQVQNFVNGMMRIFMKAPLLCIGSMVMAIRLNPQLAMVFLVVVPIVGILIAINLKVGFPLFTKVQQALDKVNAAVREYLSGIRVVKAFNRFGFEMGKFKKTNEHYQDRAIKAMQTMAIFGPSIMLTVNLGIVAILWFGGLRVNEGNMQIGEIIAFINYMTQMVFSLMIISNVFTMFVRAKTSASRVGEVFAAENELKWSQSPTLQQEKKGLIQFEHVTFSYEGAGGTPVLRNLSFTCMPGETVGIIGSTGSGKSSLVHLIPRFYDTDSGQVRVSGVDVKEMDPALLREKIAIVPQKSVLFSGSVIDNLRWGKEDATLEDMETATRMAQAHEFISSFPEGYETRLGQRGVNLSGGQKQRVSIARALIRQPDILILDDCTSAVDVATEMKIKEALKRYATQLTCLIIAQRITSVMDADKIIVLEEGQLAGIGRHEQLLQDCKVYQEIYRSQVGKEVL